MVTVSGLENSQIHTNTMFYKLLLSLNLVAQSIFQTVLIPAHVPTDRLTVPLKALQKYPKYQLHGVIIPQPWWCLHVLGCLH